MSEEFDRDLQRCRDELDDARRTLLAAVTALDDADLDRGRRGGWTVRRVLEHVIWSEWMYSRVVIHLRGGRPPGDPVDAAPSGAADAVAKLQASRAALIAAVDGVDEETFYTVGKLGQEEYSVLSLLENEINHEREHAEQVRALTAPARR
jgi:uncharacterized damage-inducible protein DinB